MLKITIELISAVTGEREIIHTAHLSNRGTGTEQVGNYTAIFYSERHVMSHYADVPEFNRKRFDAWDLLNKAITLRKKA